MSDDERWVVSSYLEAGTIARRYRGFSWCRICGRRNGFAEFTDGTYIWPQGLSHYVREHSVRLPREVVEHATHRLRDLEDAYVDQSWWRSQK